MKFIAASQTQPAGWRPAAGMFAFLLPSLAAVATARADTPAAPAAADAGPAQVADAAHQERGVRLFQLGRHEEAIAEFRKAYEIEARPELLFLIGRAYRRLGQTDKGNYFFERYLATAPAESPERDEAEAAVGAPPPPTLDPRLPAEPSGIAPLDERAPAPAAWERGWFWAAVGAVAVAGVALAVGLSRSADSELPRSDLGHKRFD